MSRTALAAAFLIGTAAPAFADGGYEPAGDAENSGPYVALRAGAVFLTEDDTPGLAEFNTGFGIVASGGYAFAPGFSGELEFSYRHVPVGGFADGRVDTFNFMANALYEADLGPVRPYLGGGVGLGVVTLESDNLGIDESEEGFAWQAIGGLAVPVSGQVDLVVDYRYVSTHIDGEDEVSSHNVTGGARFRF